MSSILPTTPTDGQAFVDSELVKWIYNASLDLWEKSGTSVGVPLANDDSEGYMSYADKQLLDSIPAVPGGFGIITDTKLLLQSEENPEGVISGDIHLLSDSLEIRCVDVNDAAISYTPIDAGCPRQTADQSYPGLSFKLSDKFIDSMIVNMPGNTGRKGKKGKKGATGKPGYSGGPAGLRGEPGPDITDLASLEGVKFNDIDGVTDKAIVRMRLLDSGNGCRLILDKSRLNTSTTAPADKVIATPIYRVITFDAPDNDCATGMSKWSISKGTGDPAPTDINLIKLPKGAGEGSDSIGFNAGYRLSSFITDIITEYEKKLKKIDEAYGKQAKEYVLGVDRKARQILSGLAGDLSNCEFNLPAVEYCITFTGCDQPPADPENPSDPNDPNPPGPPEPPPEPPTPGTFYGLNTAPPNIYQFNEGDTITMRVTCTDITSPEANWSVQATSGDLADVLDFEGPASGIVKLDKGQGKFSLKIKNDGKKEGDESFNIIVAGGEPNGATYGPITIKDTSL